MGLFCLWGAPGTEGREKRVAGQKGKAYSVVTYADLCKSIARVMADAPHSAPAPREKPAQCTAKGKAKRPKREGLVRVAGTGPVI